jgi:parvulin-like peptidyl-prolyl isomerase
LTLIKFFAAALFLTVTATLTTTAQKKGTRPAARPARPAAAAPASGVRLTADDMTLVIAGLELPPEAVGALQSDAGERKSFARDIRQMLAAAEEAKALGYAARPELKLQMELARAFVISQAYFKQRQKAGATSPEQVVTQAEIDAFLAEPAQQPQLTAFIEDYRVNGPGRGAAIAEDQRKQLAQYYGRVMVSMRKGTAAGLAADRKTQLVIMLQQARLLAGAYSKELVTKLKATDAELDAYIATHPEYDTKQSRAKIEGLLARVRAGEDFVKLANEFTEDPSGKGTGGDLGWFGRGQMVKPFEDTAFALKQGEVSGVIETQFGFHIVKTEERRTMTADDGKSAEQVHARHILIRFNAAPRTPGAPPQSPREQARAAVEEEKRHRLFDDIAARRNVQVAEDYPVASSVPAATSATPSSPSAAPPKPAAKPAAKPATPARRAPARRGN